MNIEEFVNNYLQEHRHDVLLNPHNGLVEFAKALKAEALKGAAEAEISTKFHIVGRSLISVIGMLEGFKYGDKVRIIIVKED